MLCCHIWWRNKVVYNVTHCVVMVDICCLVAYSEFSFSPPCGRGWLLISLAVAVSCSRRVVEMLSSRVLIRDRSRRTVTTLELAVMSASRRRGNAPRRSAWCSLPWLLERGFRNKNKKTYNFNGFCALKHSKIWVNKFEIGYVIRSLKSSERATAITADWISCLL